MMGSMGSVRGFVEMPFHQASNVRIAVFASGVAAEKAKEGGAVYVGAEDLALQFEEGHVDCTHVLATPDMMAVIRKVAKILGPKGLMPNVKLGNETHPIV